MRIVVGFLALCACAFCFADDTIINPSICDEVGPQGIILDKSGKVAHICHDGGRIVTRVELTCDWNNYQFAINLITNGNPTMAPEFEQKPISKEARLIIPPKHEPRAMTEAERSNCPVPLQSRVAVKTFPYVVNDVNDAQASQVRPKMLIRQGKLWYETLVLLKEQYADSQCSLADNYGTNLTLSCCTDDTAPFEDLLTPPIHQYCELENCKGPNVPFTCGCQIDAESGTVQVILENHLPANSLPSNVDFQFFQLAAYPNVTSPPRDAGQDLVLYNAALDISLLAPPELEFQQLNPALRVPPNPLVKEFTFNAFAFSSHRDAQLNISCNVEYCIRPGGPPGNNRGFPLCKPALFRA